MNVYDAKRVKELETANVRLKRLLADVEVEIEALKETARGRRWARAPGAPQPIN